MVPLVIVVGVGIFAGGAVINNNQKIARQNEAEQHINHLVEQTNQIAQQSTETAQPEEVPTESTVPAEEGAVLGESEVNIETTVVSNMDGTVTVTAKLDTTEPGTCTTIIHETQFTAIAANGACEFKDLSVPVDAKDLKIVFEADESGETGSSSTRVE